MGKIIKPGIVLFVISIVAASILGYAYEITKEPIAKQKEIVKQKSMQEVFTENTTFEDLGLSSDLVSEVFVAKEGGEIVGYAIFTSPKGFESSIEMLTGVNTLGEITGVSIISMKETPGLGDNAKYDTFRDQYKDKSGAVSVTKTGPAGDNEIVAITAATITSNAVTLGVNDALTFFNNEIGEVK